MEIIKNQHFEGERPLFETHNVRLEQVTIGNGESDANRSNIFRVGNNSTVINNHLSGVTATFSNWLTTSAITVENLTVTKAAHFFKLLIDEVKATQGQLIITPSNAVIDKVTTVNGNWRCYFRSTDADGHEISNTFEPNDQIVCQTFNAATGTTYDSSNRYYWNLCIRTGSTSITIDGTPTKCHYIDLSKTDKDPNSISTPQVGDNVVMLGNRTDTSRQSAIIISAYENQFLDGQIKAPSIAQYYGINDYNLASHRHNVLSRDFNQFKGDFTTTAGDDVATSISDIRQTNTQISSRVGNIENTYVTQNDLDDWHGDTTEVVVDARNLDETKFYPVSIELDHSNVLRHIQVNRTLMEEYGVPSYSFHQQGFTVLLDWYTKGSGWGSNHAVSAWSETDTVRYINEYDRTWTTNDELVKIVGSIGQIIQVDEEIVYVRGGSKYNIKVDRKNSNIVLHTTDYVREFVDYTDTRPVLTESELIEPRKDARTWSEILQTANNIQLNVYDELKTKTGIDVSSGMIRLQADKTIFENNSGTSAMWLRGQINGQTKWALIANDRYPIMRFGDNADSSVNCTYITPNSIHIQPTVSVNEYITFQIVEETPSIYIKRGNTTLRIYIDGNGKVRIAAESFPDTSSPWPTINEVNNGEVYADNNGYLRVKK